MKSLIVCFGLVAILSGLIGCESGQKPLPILGYRYFVNGDTVFHSIAPFQFIDQDSALITKETVNGKIYVADFFFTSCQSICPIMKTQMLRVYQVTKTMDDVVLLSHTIDPEYDTVALLKDYANRLIEGEGVASSKWHFVTGVKDSIYKIAQTSYFATAMEDKTEPDGFIHSGAFLLIDGKGHIRGKYDGTKEVEVNQLIADIKRLRRENSK